MANFHATDGSDGESLVHDMNSPLDLISGYRRFRAGVYSKQVTSYRELGLGQKPQIMMIACADSRVDPSAIFDAGPGQLFVVRNVANLVPPYEKNSAGLHGVSAALEYAVNALKVPHIVVMGHGGCGGVSAALDPRALVTNNCNEFVGPWVAMLGEAKKKVLASGTFNPQHALELEGIDVSLANLMTFPFVAAAVMKGDLTLHGAWFAIHHGELHWRNRTTGRFEVVPMLCMDVTPPPRSQSSPDLASAAATTTAPRKSLTKSPQGVATNGNFGEDDECQKDKSGARVKIEQILK
jgi:carbonic anhydrase